jgi:ABC-type branched-subunit amino acid transport system ATPase component/ABC-type branched-subunit amino acid transport system permease subunit
VNLSWPARRSGRVALPAESSMRRRRFATHAALALACAVVLWVLPYFGAVASSDLRLIALAMLYAATVMGLNLVFGLAGQVTLGPAAVFAVGAFVAGALSAHLAWSPAYDVAAGVGAAGVVGLLVGFPALRVGGFYLAMVTALVAAAVPVATKLLPDVFGGNAGLLGIAPLADPYTSYRIILVVTVATALLVAVLARSSWGRWFRVLSVSEVGASALGVSVYRAKLVAFVISALFGGIAGGLYAHYQGVIDPSQFTFDLSLALFAALVIGGLGSLWGPPIGAFIYVLVPAYLLPASGGAWVQVAYGALLIVFMVSVRGGIAGGSRRLLAALWPAGPTVMSGRSARPSRASPAASEPMASKFVAGRAARLERGGIVFRAEHVTCTFGAVRALDDAQLDLRSGQITALIGPNGSGKTTLLNVCSGVQRPSSAHISLLGRDITSAPAHRRAASGIARTFQQAMVYPGMTWTQSVMAGYGDHRVTPWSAMLSLPRSRRHEREAAARAEAILDGLGAHHMIGGSPEASTLADARIAEVARALALDPLVLLLDEAAAGLDQRDIHALERAIRAAARSGVAVLLVEHDVELVSRLADRVTVLDRGQVIFDGDPSSARTDARVVEAYMGTQAGV